MDIFDGLTALGGLCLFLFGMQIMAEALGLALPGSALMPATSPSGATWMTLSLPWAIRRSKPCRRPMTLAL